MIVPSRSIKTAADNWLVTYRILSKTGHQFIPRHGCCSKFAHYDSARVVGDFRRFGRSGSADEAEGKESDGRITCARDIEHLSSLGWNVVWRLFLLKKHHALFAESDKYIFCLPFFEQRFAGALQVRILGRSSIRIMTGNTCGEKSFGAVRLDYCQAAPLEQVTRIGVCSDDLAHRACSLCDLRHQFGREETLAVVFETNCVGLRNFFSDGGNDLLILGRRWADKLFAVDTDDLLIARNDAGFDDGLKSRLFNGIGSVDLLFGQQLPELLSAAVFSEQTDDPNTVHKFAQIAGEVGGAAGVK